MAVTLCFGPTGTLEVAPVEPPVDRSPLQAHEAGEQHSSPVTRGSTYNLALVRSLRSRVVVAFEGSDIRALRAVARTAGATALATESDLTLVPMRSFSSWASSEPLSGSLVMS